jgi:tyrosyl-tRNA synthetase
LQIINNADWLKMMTLNDFLRLVGKDFNIGYLLNKENTAAQIDIGLSYTKFSYTLLQAFDFHHLYKNYDCTVQFKLVEVTNWETLLLEQIFVNKLEMII